MKQTKLFSDSRYAPVPKLYYPDVGHMVLPVCPEFKTFYSYVCKANDTVDGLARLFYGDSSYQWVILVSNEFFPFPPKLEVGITLLIPAREEVMEFMRGQDNGI